MRIWERQIKPREKNPHPSISNEQNKPIVKRDGQLTMYEYEYEYL